MSLRESTEAAFKAATHLTSEHQGLMTATLMLADKIDQWDLIVQWAVEDANRKSGKPVVPAHDNTSFASYLKFMDALGFTVQATVPQRQEGQPDGLSEARNTSLAARTRQKAKRSKK